MNKWKELREYYKRNPTKYYEDILGVKFTKLQKIKLKIYIWFENHFKKKINNNIRGKRSEMMILEDGCEVNMKEYIRYIIKESLEE